MGQKHALLTHFFFANFPKPLQLYNIYGILVMTTTSYGGLQ